MISKLENERINQELKKIVNDYKSSYEILRQKSETKYKNSLQPGATFHARPGFYYDEDRAAFEEVCDSLRKKAHAIVDGAALEIMAQNTAAPSNEAVNVVTLINSRQNVSAEEIDQLMTKYGQDCPMVYKALHEKAQSLGYRDFKPHPITEVAENIERLSGTIDSSISAFNERNMVATTAGLGVTIDTAFPTEE